MLAAHAELVGVDLGALAVGPVEDHAPLRAVHGHLLVADLPVEEERAARLLAER
ncbi:MAG: hypothetical protein ACF8NJ_01005 [Phycisphaerales bacterium JB038]